LRITDDSDPDFEQVQSKWYYEFAVKKDVEMFIGLHQEDERIQGVASRRPFIDTGVCVIRVNEDETFELVNYNTITKER
jgi:hypothetical protein